MALIGKAMYFYKISSCVQTSLKIMEINLTDGNVEEHVCEDDVLRALLGGRCLGVALLSRRRILADPLEPSSPVVVSVGAMAGTGFPLANRLTMVFRSPLTGTVAWTQTGGYAAYELARLGVRALIITGAAEKLSCLLIDSKGVSLVDAEGLRGCGAMETCSRLRQAYGDCRVLSIGPAGERLVKISTVVNDMGRASGVRHGIGAIFGSKNLKAIVLKSGKHDARKPHDTLRFARLIRKLHAKMASSNLLNHEKGLFAVHGTAIAAEAIGENHALPVQNYRRTWHTAFQEVGGHMLTSTVLMTRLTCSTCPVSCRRETLGKGLRGEGPDYAQISSLGTNCMLFDLDEIAYLTQICYEHGVDPIEMGNTLAVYADLSERGYVRPKLGWGDYGAMASLVERVADKEEVGEVLAEGAFETAKSFGDADAAPSVKKISIQNADPRAEHAWGLVNAVENFGGAAHVWVYPQLVKSFQSLGVETIHDDNPDAEKLAERVYVKQTQVAVLDSLGVCAFSALAFTWQDYAEGFTSFYGTVLEDDFTTLGEKILTMERMLNTLYGFSEDSDKLPKRFVEEPIPDGKHAGEVCPLNDLMRPYVKIRRDIGFSDMLSCLSFLS